MTAYAVRFIGPPLQGADGPNGWEVAERGSWRTPENAEERALVARCIRIVAACPRGWDAAAGAAFIGSRGVDVEQLGELEVVAIVERLTSFVGHTNARPFAELVCEALGHQVENKIAGCPGCYFEGHVNGPLRRAFAEQLHAAGWRADVLGDAEETARGAALMLVEFGSSAGERLCYGTGRDPEALAVRVGADDACPVCYDPQHPLYAARHGHVCVPRPA